MISSSSGVFCGRGKFGRTAKNNSKSQNGAILENRPADENADTLLYGYYF
jgi:hypothetical protein